jgi:prophage regulatory protein
MFMLRGSASDPMLCLAQRLTTGVATSLSRGICNGTEASHKEGTQVDLRYPYCPAHIARLEVAGQFPKRIKLGACRVAWVAEEVETWIEERIGNR